MAVCQQRARLAVVFYLSLQAVVSVASVSDDGYLARVNVQLAAKLYKQLDKYGLPNLVYSPFGVLTALHVVYDAADERTRTQLNAHLALRLGNDDAEDVLQKTRARVLENANRTGLTREAIAVFVSQVDRYEQAYVSNIARRYGAAMVQVDFDAGRKAIRDSVNNWIEEKTGNIRSVLDRGSVITQLPVILVDALYLRSNVMSNFRAGQLTFQVYSDAVKVVKSLHAIGEFKYVHMSELQLSVLELPLVGDKMSVCLLLPDKDLSLFPPLTEHLINAVASDLTLQLVNVSIPELSVVQNIDLKEILEEIGISAMFNPSASSLSRPPSVDGQRHMRLSKFVHYSRVEIRAEAKEMSYDATDQKDTTQPAEAVRLDISQFIADRPFMFLIRDTTNGIVLFAGRISYPSRVATDDFKIRALKSSCIVLCASRYLSVLVAVFALVRHA